MFSFFNLVLTQPLTNILLFFYNTIAFKDLGVAIIFLTLFIRLVLFPFFHKSTRQQIIMQHLQPKVKDIQKQYKDDRIKQSEALMALYAEHGINPFSGILFLLIQIPILLSLYHVFINIFDLGKRAALYGFVADPGALNPMFLSLINLDERSILLVALAAGFQFLQGKLMLPPKEAGRQPSPQEAMSRNMMLIGPVITFVIFYNLDAAVSLYWAATSFISIIQQVMVNRDLKHLKQGLSTKTDG